jgi:hypothetical protein
MQHLSTDWSAPIRHSRLFDSNNTLVMTSLAIPLRFIFNRAIRLPCRRHLNIVAVNVARCPGALITSF